MQVVYSNYFLNALGEYIPFYFILIGIIMFNFFLNKSKFIKRRIMNVIFVSAFVASIVSIYFIAIDNYLNDLRVLMLNSNYTSLSAYCLNNNIPGDYLNNLRNLCLLIDYCLELYLSIHIYFLFRKNSDVKKELIIALPTILTIIFFVIAYLTKLSVYFDSLNYTYQNVSYYFLLYVVTIFNDIMCITELIKSHYKRSDLLFLLFFTNMTMFVSIMWDLGIIDISIATYNTTVLISAGFVYLVIINNKMIEESSEVESALVQSRVESLTNQIRPHFIFNCISNIVELIDDKSPAKKALMGFAKYLRINLNALNKSNPMPFENELEYIQNYISLEHLRYPKEFTISYHIKTKNFLIPLVSVEVFVENAIKHNILKKKKAIKVELRTYEINDFYVIEVIDDGVGFDPKLISDNGNFVGTYNAKYRLEKMVNAKVDIDSIKDFGTTVRIQVPKTWGNSL